ncbi:hypothetical protein ACVMGC_010292 [Bradyrhizobium barranii subsp. barranii]|nr:MULTISPECIES: SLATT domain-containing protein [Bradyrhizobium]MBR0884729.1 SLATT domain-containing protein [Bradyrhizobium liaoningense]MBR1003694.1 SLATT domain-containing protein [Bradyrhizobium liaoningense]MBR1070787.1 SLATT domain-containing protein [Bradyrhizobium liaoningense]MCP1780747.1 hypothetical protein [Bradyrhizobium japonicum]MCP1956260.1 hypothetical protein [Bradyrhizobium japonicum]
MTEYSAKFLGSLKSTSAARFHASQRLAARDRKLTRLTAFTSAYVIALTILPYFMKLPQEVTDNLNLITVAFSIIILVSSLLQYSSGDVVNAEQHQRCALEIDEIQRDIRIKMPNVTEAELREFCKRYNQALQKYSINHDEVDFMKYQLDRPHEYPWLGFFEQIRFRLKIAYSYHVHTALLIAVTAFLAWLIFFYAYPARLVAH